MNYMIRKEAFVGQNPSPCIIQEKRVLGHRRKDAELALVRETQSLFRAFLKDLGRDNVEIIYPDDPRSERILTTFVEGQEYRYEFTIKEF